MQQGKQLSAEAGIAKLAGQTDGCDAMCAVGAERPPWRVEKKQGSWVGCKGNAEWESKTHWSRV